MSESANFRLELVGSGCSSDRLLQYDELAGMEQALAESKSDQVIKPDTANGRGVTAGSSLFSSRIRPTSHAGTDVARVVILKVQRSRMRRVAVVLVILLIASSSQAADDVRTLVESGNIADCAGPTSATTASNSTRSIARATTQRSGRRTGAPLRRRLL